MAKHDPHDLVAEVDLGLGPHAVTLPDELRPRIAGNTVVWMHDAVTYRLETKLGRAAAVRLAETVG